jgi:hypothetical protein
MDTSVAQPTDIPMGSPEATASRHLNKVGATATSRRSAMITKRATDRSGSTGRRKLLFMAASAMAGRGPLFNQCLRKPVALVAMASPACFGGLLTRQHPYGP